MSKKKKNVKAKPKKNYLESVKSIELKDFIGQYIQDTIIKDASIQAFSIESVRFIDEKINDMTFSEELNEVEHEWLSMVGVYLGQCILEMYSGRWFTFENGEKDDPHHPCVEIDGFGIGNPISKVYKRVFNSEEDSLTGFLLAIQFLIEKHKEELLTKI